MLRAWSKRIALCIPIIVVMAATVPPAAHAQRLEEVETSNKRVKTLYLDGEYARATPLAERTLAASERVLGRQHRSTLTSVNNLATLYKALGRYQEAEPLYSRALEGRERVLGRNARDTLESVDDTGELYLDQGRYDDAERLFKRALEGRGRTLGKEHADTLESLGNLVVLYIVRGRYDEAETLSIRALAASERRFGKEHRDTLEQLSVRASLYNARGDYGKAELLSRRTLEARERILGKEHPSTHLSVNNLAFLYINQGRYDEAEPLLKRAMDGWKHILGEEHPKTLTIINNLAVLYYAQGRYDAAEPYFKLALETQERTLGKEHPGTLISVNNLASLYTNQGRYGEAEPLLERGLEAYERILGDNHPNMPLIINTLGQLRLAQGRYGEAEPLMKRAMEGAKRILGKEHAQTLTIVNNLAQLYSNQGRYGEAERLQKQTLEACERTLGGEHPNTLLILSNLALQYFLQDRFNDAEPLQRRVLETHERVLGKDNPNTLMMLSNLAITLSKVPERYGEAEQLIKRAVETSERVLGKEHPNTLLMVSNLAALYESQGHYGEAEPLLKQMLETSERVLGREHPDTLVGVHNLASFHYTQGRYGDAEQLYKRALEGHKRVLDPEHPRVVTELMDLAGLYFNQGDWVRAAEVLQRSTSITARRLSLGMQGLAPASTKMMKDMVGEWRHEFWLLVKAASLLTRYDSAFDAELTREMFKPAQWAIGTEAARSLAQMAARGTGADPELAALVRKREDLIPEWQKRDALRNTALALAPDKRNAKAEAENLTRLSAIEARIREISERLAVEFPDYAALASPQPLSIEEVQGLLGTDEAVVLFLDTIFAEVLGSKQGPAETFIWVVTKTDVRWVRSDLDILGLAGEVGALRCGLDAAIRTNARCAELAAQSGGKHQLSFDLVRAHALYKAIFGKVEDLIKGKHLLIVPSGALTMLPFQVLVTEPPANDDYRSAAWLIRDHAITVLPAVSSLKALRRVARPSAASKPMIGFGNPLLDGPDSSYGAKAKLAREKRSCSETNSQRESTLFGPRGGIQIESRGGLVDVARIRELVPLPETTDELCAVAHDLGANVGELRLGARATEREVKALSGSGELAQYRIVHFATHGAMAGGLRGTSEPGLILTPPGEASEADDGYLSASEIAALKLDADWVILSACNTAAGNTANTETLSGLARAFIYAQARTLLVSHWEVYSDATVKLITTAMREMARDSGVGRAEALRRAMLALIDKGAPIEAHPAYWAPFVVVGEGAR